MNNNCSFRHIVSGQFNKDAIRIAKEVSQNPGKSINPLIITGCWGSGKTLLMKAIGNEYNINFNKDKIGFFSAEMFISDYKKAVAENNVTAFRNSYQSHALILIDSIEYLEGHQKAQEEFIRLVDYCIENKKQIVCTLDSLANSDRPSVRISVWKDYPVVKIDLPDVDTMTDIINQRTKKYESKYSNRKIPDSP